MKLTQHLVTFGLTSLSAAIPLEDFFKTHQAEERSVGYCSFDLSQFEPIALTGNPAGSGSYCESEWGTKYKPIEQINLWWTASRLQGIQAIYTDTYTSPVYGSTDAPSHAVIGVNYGAGDRWNKWTTWYNQNGDGRISAFEIGASNGQLIHAGYTNQQLSSMGLVGQGQNVGNGFLFGFEGNSVDPGDGGGVTQLGALFLSSPISNIQISGIQFGSPPIGSNVSNIESLATAHYYNGQTTGTSMWNFQDAAGITTSRSFTSTSTFTYGGSIAFMLSGDFFGIAGFSNSDTFMYQAQQGSMQQTSEMRSTTVTWAESGTLNPGEGVDCQTIVGHGQGTFSYTSTVTVTLQNGFQFNYPEGGSSTVDLVSNAVVTVVQANHP